MQVRIAKRRLGGKARFVLSPKSSVYLAFAASTSSKTLPHGLRLRVPGFIANLYGGMVSTKSGAVPSHFYRRIATECPRRSWLTGCRPPR